MRLVKRFRNSSIRTKFSVLILLNGSVALLLVGLSLLGYERFQMRREAEHAISTEAGIIAESSTGALSFRDERAASETLAALRGDLSLIDAAIYDSDNHLFVWHRNPKRFSNAVPERPPSTLTRTGVWFEDGTLSASRPITMGGQTIGTVLLRASTGEFESRMRSYVGIVTMATLFSLGIALLLSSTLQKSITRPLALLAGVAKHVSLDRDYSARVNWQAADETGVVIGAFNEMLAQIEQHEKARKAAEESLRESEERFALAARGANDGLWDWRQSDGRFYLSPRGNQMLGYPEAEKYWGDEEWNEHVHPTDRPRVLNAWRTGIRQTGEIVCEYRMRHCNGTFIWVLSRGKAVRDGTGRVVRAAGSLTDVTDGKIADPLTGLPNRLYFLDRLESALEASARSAVPVAVLFLDLDQFKVVNDSLGHAAGDELLVEVAQGLQSCTRKTSREDAGALSTIVARLGGDEFAVLLHGDAATRGATALAERILRQLGQPVHLAERQMFANCSIGIAFSSGGETPADLLRNADTAMYQAKKGGRGRFEIFDQGMRESAMARLEIETDLRRAIDAGQLVLFYQPQIDLRRRRITGCEALARWQHPSRGLVSPEEFIPIAEETGLIVPLGRWALKEACKQTAVWQRRFPSSPPLSVAVNVTYGQLASETFVEDVERALAESNLMPGTLRLEMTESTLMKNSDETIRVLERLRKLGVGLEIDDFGTGYSSLSTLNRLPFDTLKIDCSFVRDLGTSAEGGEIVRAIVELARSMNLRVVGEGVETNGQLHALEALGCHYAQGYYFSRPVPAGEIAVQFEAESLKRGFAEIEASAGKEAYVYG